MNTRNLNILLICVTLIMMVALFIPVQKIVHANNSTTKTYHSPKVKPPEDALSSILRKAQSKAAGLGGTAATGRVERISTFYRGEVVTSVQSIPIQYGEVRIDLSKSFDDIYIDNQKVTFERLKDLSNRSIVVVNVVFVGDANVNRTVLVNRAAKYGVKLFD